MNDEPTNPLVEAHLPQQFIYDLGLYLQTCAHIEVAVCSLLAEIECRLDGRVKKADKFHELRKVPIGDLTRLLGKKSKHLDGEWGEFLEAISELVGRYKENRHIAAHGAFFVKQPEKTLKVLYTHKVRNHGKVFFRPEETEISRELVLELIADADRLLRHLSFVAQDVEMGKIRVTPI